MRLDTLGDDDPRTVIIRLIAMSTAQVKFQNADMRHDVFLYA